MAACVRQRMVIVDNYGLGKLGDQLGAATDELQDELGLCTKMSEWSDAYADACSRLIKAGGGSKRYGLRMLRRWAGAWESASSTREIDMPTPAQVQSLLLRLWQLPVVERPDALDLWTALDGWSRGYVTDTGVYDAGVIRSIWQYQAILDALDADKSAVMIVLQLLNSADDAEAAAEEPGEYGLPLN